MQNGVPSATTVKTVTLAPLASQVVVLDGLSGDPAIQSSFLVQSDGNPGDVGAKMISRGDAALPEVELMGKDLDGATNGGNHPWNIENGNQSTLLLFNTSAKAQYFNVEISAGNVQWRKAYLLQPMETHSISINDLSRTTAKDDKGVLFPADIGAGQVAWHMPAKNAGRGRVLESNRETAMARNFACGYVAELCEVIFYGYIDGGIGDGSTDDPFGEMEPQVCMNTCSGTPAGPGGNGYYYNWSVDNSGIASISGSSTDYYVGLYGASGGSTYLEGDGSDGFCQVQMPPNPVSVVAVSQSPSTISMSTGDTNKVLTVAVNPASVASQSQISQGLQSNPNSSSNASMTFTPPQSFSGNDNWTIAASGSNSPSGIFSATACAMGICSQTSSTITVPPQLLIQMMYAEANGTNQTAMQSVGEAIENRFSSQYFTNQFNTWQNSLVSGQVALNTSITTGVEPELDAAVNVFTDHDGGWCSALAWWTPTSAQWANVQAAINSGTTTFPSGTGAPTYSPSTWPTSAQKILYVSSVGTQGNGTPNFLYLAPRTSGAAAVSTSCN